MAKRHKFLLLQGCYGDRVPVSDKDGKVERFEERMYNPGDTIETDLDLMKMFNRPGYKPKFGPTGGAIDDSPITAEELARRGLAQGVDPGYVASTAQAVSNATQMGASQIGQQARKRHEPEPLEKMSDAELKARADAEEIDIKDCETRAEIIERLREAGV